MGMVRPVDRLARVCVGIAARRWPDALRGDLTREWHAELDALRDDPALGAGDRARQAIAFATSLACRPAVEADGDASRTWHDRAFDVGGPVMALLSLAGVTLLAAALVDVVHDVHHGLGGQMAAITAGLAGIGLDGSLAPTAAGLADIGLLTVAAGAMAWLGIVAARRRRVARPALAIAALGLTTYAFLLAGNRVAIMPFMGWIDIAPAVAAWITLTSLSVTVAARCAAAGHHRRARWTRVSGAVIALDAAAVCGSAHAASVLGVGFGSAPAWLPLALLPGGTTRFGRFYPHGAPSFGGLSLSGHAFHGSDILLGNVSTMVSPLLLCSAFAVAYSARSTAARRSAARGLARDRAVAGTAARFALLVTSVVGALAMPMSATLGTAAPGAATYVLTAVWWIVAATSALAARTVPLARAATVAVLLVPLAASMLATSAGVTAVIDAPFAVVALAVARWDRTARATRQVGLWLLLSAAAAGISASVSGAVRQSGVVNVALARIEDNSAVFGFGFSAHIAGWIALAVMIGILAARCAMTTEPP